MKKAVSSRGTVIRIVAIYAIVGALWIYSSDTVLGWLIHDPRLMVRLAIFKGGLFILVTSLLLYTLINRYARHITASEQALSASEKFQRAILDAEPECVKLVDEAGNLLMMNRAGLGMLEAASLDQVKGQCLYPLLLPPYRSAFQQLVTRAFQGETGSFQFEAIGLKGRHLWLETRMAPFRDEAGHIVAALGITRDITDRRLAEESLLASEAKFRTLVESSFDVIFVLDCAGIFQFVSPAWEKHFGFPVDQVIGHDFRPFVHPDDAPLCAEYLGRVMTTGLSDTSPPYRVRHADGSWRLFMANGTPYTDASGTLLYLGVGRDISGQKQAEEERLRLERQFLHAQKLESLGVLAGGIAHDFNNILAAIIGNLDLTLMDLDKDSPPYETISRAMKASRRAADLTRQMLAFSGRGIFQLQRLSLNEVVRNNAELFRTTVPKTITFIMETADGLPLVEADPGQLQQVVMNLITNAAESVGSQAGTITLSTGVMTCDASFLERSRLEQKPPPGRYAYLEVADTGCGMDAETQQRLFEPFYTTKFTGRGLGMAAVLGIIKAHRGAIILDSEAGRGSVFRVLLPALATAIEPAPAQPALPLREGGTQLIGTVLVVDDEPEVRELCASCLVRLGLTPLCAGDGMEALELFNRQATEIAMVVLDLTMPRMDGTAAFRELKRLRPDLPVIVSSGFSEQDTAVNFPDEKPAAFLHKPFTAHELQDRVRHLLGG